MTKLVRLAALKRNLLITATSLTDSMQGRRFSSSLEVFNKLSHSEGNALMKAHWKVFTCLIIAFFVTAVLVAQKPKDPPLPDVSQFPILDYEQKSRTPKSKNPKKYNSRHGPKISESSGTIWSMNDWDVDLPALPVSKSEAVILGEVTQADAQLSDDETNIYSEFTIQVAEVLKNDKNFCLGVGNSVVVERSGGRVRLPSGKVIVAQNYNQDLPRVGKRYVLFLIFLTRDESDTDFHILTGYELRDGKVFPLDKLSPSHPITAYAGTSEAAFFVDLNKVLAGSTSQP
jgi:hypothetical protein